MPHIKKTSSDIAAEVFASDYYQEGIKNLKTTGEMNEFLKQLVAPTLQTILEGELDHHVGYKKHEYVGRGTGNSRNGHYEKTIKGVNGTATVEIPRDRNGTFNPQAVRTYETIDNDIEERTVSMYAKGMTTRDIAAHVADMYGVEVSDPMISTIYAVYRNLKNPHQLCCAHILRKLRDLAASSEIAGAVRDHCVAAYQRFAELYAAIETARTSSDPSSSYHELLGQLQRFTLPHPLDPAKLTRTKEQVAPRADRYLTCLLHPHVAADNNAAERSLRHLVLKRKVSFGSLSEKTAETLAILCSVLLSYKQRGALREYLMGV